MGGSKREKAVVDEDCKRVQVLQAVVLADSFDSTFRPVTLDTPKVLLPLCGVPILDYTIEVLAKSGVGEILIVCVSHAAKIGAYLDEQREQRGRWKSSTTTGAELEVRCVAMKGCGSAGDALRELDQRNVVQSDPFILISSDVVTNVNLTPIIEEHRARKKRDPDATMTVVMQRAGARSESIRPLVSEDVVVSLDAATSQIVAWHDNICERPVYVSARLLAGCDCVEVRHDLTDCYIDVCSPEVLWRYSENFDYQHRRADFVANEVANTELGQKIFAYELRDGDYAARLHDPRVYDAVATDVLDRWCHPLVPDAPTATWGAHGAAECSSIIKRGAYRGVGVVAPRSAMITAPASLGAHVKIGERCLIRAATVGEDSDLADDTAVVGSHLGARCVLKKGARVEDSLLGADCVLRAGATVARGCVLGAGVIVGAGVHLAPFSRLTARREKRSSFDDTLGGGSPDAQQQAPGGVGPPVCGPDGVGRPWLPEDVESDDSDGDSSDDDGDRKQERRRFFGEIDLMRACSIGAKDEVRWRADLWTEWHDESDDDDDESTVQGDAEMLLAADGFGEDDRPPMMTTAALVLSAPIFDDFRDDDDDHDHDNDDAPPAIPVTAAAGPTDLAFGNTVREMIASGAGDGADVESMLMELNCYKLSENRSFRDAVPAALDAVVALATSEAATKTQVIVAVKKAFSKWQKLLAKLCSEDEAHAVAALEHLALSAESNAGDALLADPDVFRAALQLLYEDEIISDDGILAWAQDHANPNKRLVESTQIRDFVEWLKEDDDDDDEDGD